MLGYSSELTDKSDPVDFSKYSYTKESEMVITLIKISLIHSVATSLRLFF